jgi:hypothetical protein
MPLTWRLCPTASQFDCVDLSAKQVSSTSLSYLGTMCVCVCVYVYVCMDQMSSSLCPLCVILQAYKKYMESEKWVFICSFGLAGVALVRHVCVCL